MKICPLCKSKEQKIDIDGYLLECGECGFIYNEDEF